MSINDLSCEVLMMIFSNFNQYELLHTVAPVCKQWQFVANDPFFWTKITLNMHQLSSPLLKEVLLSKCSFLVEFTLSCGGNLSEFAPYFLNCPRLRKIHILHCVDVNTKFIEQLVNNCPLVEDLKIVCSILAEPIEVLEAVVRWEMLKSVGFYYLMYHENWEQLDNEFVLSIANNWENLENIELELRGMNESSFETLVTKKGSKIKILQMDFWHLNAGSSCLLSKCPFLSKLRISGAGLLEDNHFFVLTELKYLTRLDIQNAPKLSSPGICYLFRGKTLSGLLELALNYCVKLDDVAMKVVAQCCSSLQYLELRQCMITNLGLNLIASNCRNLKHLRVSEMNNINKDGLIDISTALPALLQLSIFSCSHLTRSVIQTISRLNPSIRVFGYSQL